MIPGFRLRSESVVLSLCTWMVALLFIPVSLKSEAKKSYPLSPFACGEVKLEAGTLQRQLYENLEFYLRIPNDNLLKGFRQRAGIPSYGTGLGGFYEQDIFHVFGQILAGYSRLYAATGDSRCLTKVNTLLDEWAKTIDRDGYFYYSKQPNAPHYIFEKTLGGVVDCYLFTGSKKALECMERITDWAIKNLDKERLYGYNMGFGNTEWYTLSENLFRAYQITGQEKYLRFAEFWEYPEFWGIIRTGGDPFAKKTFYHAYSHLNTFSGAAAAYRVKGEEEYLETLRAAYTYFRENQCLVTGGFGVMERLLPAEGIRKLLKEVDHTFEVSCCSWAGFKLCKALIEFTGEARFGDWIEELMINGIGSTIPMEYDGRNHHYANYNPKGATKENFPVGWYCCTGTRPQAVADYQNLIWFHDTENLYMNLFAASSLEWKKMQITQQTVFPEENKTTVQFKGGAAKFAFSFRKPGWLSADPAVTVNGEVVTPGLDKGWYRLRRTWKQNDRLEITLPMEMRISTLPDGKPYPAALKYGPVAMAVKIPTGGCPIEVLTATKTAIAGEPLNFHIEGYPELLLRPYYAFGEGERYFLYVDSETTQPVPDAAIVRHGTWVPGGGGPAIWHSGTAGDGVEISFEGTNIRWKYYQDGNGGVASILLDGVDLGKIDLWDVTGTPGIWEKVGLQAGKHTLRLTLDPPNGKTGGRNINYYTFEVIQ